jgi:hypothetical protein
MNTAAENGSKGLRNEAACVTSRNLGHLALATKVNMLTPARSVPKFGNKFRRHLRISYREASKIVESWWFKLSQLFW